MSSQPQPFDRQAAERQLRTLEPLLGTWRIGGDAPGTVTYQWADMGGWIIQHVELDSEDGPTRGVEYIGYDTETSTLRSYYFSGTGELLRYTYRLDGTTLSIFFGDETSPAKYVGTFDPDFTSSTGGWQWPGGGYQTTMTRIDGGDHHSGRV
ncbi:hypothetical protein [Kribbella italica]|uniref:DUF1579 domain-containing protein n=1 Tax=Kribbella italica TaxID=1540520 RepID=A0A7W9MTR0_9ACTN|nr:hypothetical protein [Kribbella italica]MBB5836056.1 hypothetical protein [Kribbella italica]